MILVKRDEWSLLSVPLSSKLFGDNKTWRGFIILPALSSMIALNTSVIFGYFVHSHLYDFLIGLGLGLSYLLSELPNSYFKRRLGIKQGEHSSKFKYLQFFIDKADSIIGILLFYYFVTNTPFIEICYLFVIAIFIHFIVSALLVFLKIKQSF